MKCAYCEDELPGGGLPGPRPRLKKDKQPFFCDEDCQRLWESQTRESLAREISHPIREWKTRSDRQFHGEHNLDGRAPNDRPEKDWDPQTRLLKTKALDNAGYEYQVALEKKPTPWNRTPEWTLKVGHTPGQWLMRTLMEKGHLHNEIYIDFGQGWKIVNFGDVFREAVTLI